MSRLFYKNCAGRDWNKALPIGNGRLGAMIFGNPDCEHLQLNQDSLWYGGPMNRINQDAKDHLDEVRSLILAGRISEAEELLLHTFTATPQSERTYSTLGDLYIRFLNLNGEMSGYERELDLENAVFRLRKTFGKTTYREEIFASAPTGVIVAKFSTDDGTPFDADVNFGRMTFYDSAFHDESTVYSLGSMVGEDYRYAAGLTSFHTGGSVTCQGEYLVCRKVTELVLLFTATTTFYVPDPLSEVRFVLTSAKHRDYAELLSDHIADYRSLFTKTELSLNYEKELDDVPTDDRLKLFSPESPDNGLVKTYFDFGRYLLISCSREGSLPANLQGIWNMHMDPPWGSKYTININAEMNYWPAEMFGLGTCHLPLFDLLLRMCDNGRRTARDMYGCRGTVAHHNTDMWGDTAPQDAWIPATYWVMGMAWLCTHIWEHYRYTKDLAFLEKMYPVMRESVLFFHDFLVEEKDTVILCPSISPENTYRLPNGEEGHLCYNSTMDIEILRDLFNDFLKAAEYLDDADTDFINRTKELLAKLPPIRVGRFGQVMEWPEDYEETEPGHRHISHLYALYPSDQIHADDPDRTLFDAANVTIQRRLKNGGGHTGWSRAWIMNLYVRLRESERFYENLVALLKRSTLDNLFDNHPPFQIDGNFGAIAAIGEAFLYSTEGKAVLLPALPKEFSDGFLKGIRAKGGAVYDLTIADGLLKTFTVRAESADYNVTVVWHDRSFTVSLKQGEEAEFAI
ncbi:MAG: glycoside hydrolase family 95 protein [Lachnospiraceae bacterium]|nr:glycoside hydrolase family 95 protein [Lachnospiraceae bacterium]